MESLSSVGLLNHNICEVGEGILVYTDIKVYEDFSQSLYLTFISKTNDGITDFELEGCELDSSISEETSEGEYVTRIEIMLQEDDTRIKYMGVVEWVTTFYEDELYVTLPNSKTISYSEDDGFMDDPCYYKESVENVDESEGRD